MTNAEDPVVQRPPKPARRTRALGARRRPARAAGPAGFRLLGRHNALNALMAQAVLAELGVAQAADDDALAAAAAEGFEPLASRLAGHRRRSAGVTFVDDSLSTNVLPTLAALDAFPDSRVALIAGGFDRGVDYAPLAAGVAAAPGAAARARGAGTAGRASSRRCTPPSPAPLVETRLTAGVEEATRLGFDWAAPDGVVLLSPAAPSFGAVPRLPGARRGLRRRHEEDGTVSQ